MGVEVFVFCCQDGVFYECGNVLDMDWVVLFFVEFVDQVVVGSVDVQWYFWLVVGQCFQRRQLWVEYDGYNGEYGCGD